MSGRPEAWSRFRGGDGLPPPRVLLVAAHPDDETLGAGAQFARLAPALTIVHTTDGAPRNMLDARRHGFATWQDYAQARRLELETALVVGGAVGGTDAACFVPDESAPEHVVLLRPEQAERKRRMLECFITQLQTPGTFSLEQECFRCAPAYDFTQPPPGDESFYDRFDWGVGSATWREHARHALAALAL